MKKAKIEDRGHRRRSMIVKHPAGAIIVWLGMDSFKDLHSKTSRAYAIRLSFQGLFEQPDIDTAQVYLKKWYWWASHSQLEPVTKTAKTVKEHWNGILNWFNSRVNNGVLEGINSLIQAAKAKARGYRTITNLVTMCYIIAGKLDFSSTY